MTSNAQVESLSGVVSPTVLIVLISIVIYASLTQIKLPRLGQSPGLLGWNTAAAKQEFKAKGHSIVAAAFGQSPNGKFIVQTEDTARILLPPKYLPELNTLSETHLSHRESIVLRHVGEYTGMDIVRQSHLYSDVCRVQLTRHLRTFDPHTHLTEVCTDLKTIAQLLPFLVSVADKAVPGFIANFESKGAPIPAIGFSYFTISRLFSLVLVGEPLYQNEKWLATITEYPKLMNAVSGSLRAYPKYLRPLIAPFRPEVKALREYQGKVRALLDPVIETRRGQKGKHMDCLQWLLDNSEPHETDNQSMMLKLMFLTMAGIHTSAMALDHALLDLCVMPHYQTELREEIKQMLASSDNQWTTDGLKKLSKLDSFLKESQRVNHPAVLGFHRKVIQPVELSDGFVLPKDWIVSMPAEVMTTDQAFYDDPKTFDGYRFHKLRKEQTPLSLGGNEKPNPAEYVNIQPGNLAWGSGRFTCPGRWYADVQLKLTLAKVLLGWDLSLLGGAATPRPKNTYSDEKIMPDMTAMVKFTAVKTA